MRIHAILWLALISPAAFASYVNSCELEIQLSENASSISNYVQQDGIETEQSLPAIIRGKVLSAKALGRSDGGCQHYVGQTIEKALNANGKRIHFEQDQRIRIQIIKSEYEDVPFSETVTYLPETKSLQPK